MKTCLLCDQRADSREHYIPSWLSKVCQAQHIDIIRGKSTGEVVTTAQQIGPFKNAQSRLLCRLCNSALGKNIETQVNALLSPYVTPDAAFDSLKIEGEILVKWMMLRALEVSVVLGETLMALEIGNQIVDMCRSGRDRIVQGIWPWFTPSLEAVFVRQQTLGSAVSKSFYSTERGPVKSATSGFWFFLQMNRLGLLLIYAPSAQRNNSKGYGLKLFPPNITNVDTKGVRTSEIPIYDNIIEVYSKLTRLNTESIA